MKLFKWFRASCPDCKQKHALKNAFYDMSIKRNVYECEFCHKEFFIIWWQEKNLYKHFLTQKEEFFNMKPEQGESFLYEAVQYIGDNVEQVRLFAGDSFYQNKDSGEIFINFHGKRMRVSVNDWVCKGRSGFYACKEPIFL